MEVIDKVNSLSKKQFSTLEEFTDFLNKLGFDVSNIRRQYGCIRFGLVSIIGFEKNGIITPSFNSILSQEILKKVSDDVLNTLLGNDPAKETVSKSFELVNYDIKGKLEYDEEKDFYFIDGYSGDDQRKNVHIEFKLVDIDMIQNYLNSPERIESEDNERQDEDAEYFNEFKADLKDLIDSKSILLITETKVDGKKVIEIKIQFDLRRN